VDASAKPGADIKAENTLDKQPDQVGEPLHLQQLIV
jgi:hypothetical protein